MAVAMPSLLTRWWRRKYKKQPEPPKMPSPHPRPRPLTPTSPSSSSTDTTTATANSMLFQRVPSEIRRHILIYAFGEQVMHIDLRLEYPLKKRLKQPTQPSHANVRPHSDRDSSKPKQWEWFGCVCHRENQLSFAPPARAWMVYGPPGDSCRNDYTYSPMCDYWPGCVPAKCFVGAMGWLRACRQAYSEGVEVLYHTNTIHFEGMDMLRLLPETLLPQRLAAITSVELLWNLHPWGEVRRQTRREDFPPDSGMAGFISLLEAFPGTLPNLKYLYLSLQGELKPPDGHSYEETFKTSKELLHHVDCMVVKLERLTDCRIALAASCYHAYKLMTTGRDAAWLTSHEDWGKDMLWRDLLSQGNTSCHAISGYWLCQGKRDISPPHDIPFCICFL